MKLDRFPGVATDLGNNADTGCVRIIEKGKFKLTPKQRAEMEHKFRLHTENVKASLAGYLVRNTRLSDGSLLRIVSNSGQHLLIVEPVAPAVTLQDLPCGVFCIPADTTNEYGWVPPPVEGANGTPGTELDRTDAGNFLVLRPTEESVAVRKILRFQEQFSASNYNTPLFELGQNNNTSLQNWQHREWVAPDRKAIVTTYTGTIQINGVDFTPPSFGVLLWACVYQYNDGSGLSNYLFAVGVSGVQLQFSRRTLNGTTWEQIAAVDVSSLDSLATSNVHTWIRKVDCNESRTTCSVWIQYPSAETAGSASRWVGITDVDMGTGEVTHTPATTETVTNTITGSGEGTHTSTVAWSGERQIAFEYVGDDKVFTLLRFSGAEVTTTSTSSSSTSIHRTRTKSDNRTVTLVRDSFEIEVFNSVINSYSYSENGSYTPNPSPPVGPGSYGRSEESSRTWTFVKLLYYGGRGEVFAVRSTQLTQNTTSSSISVGGGYFDGFPCETSLDIVTGPWERADTIYVMGEELANGTQQSPVQETSASGSEVIFMGALGTGPGSTVISQFWGAVTATALAGSGAGLALPGHPLYKLGIEIPDTSYMNCRVVDDFVILSVPKLTDYVVGDSHTPVQNPEEFQTYCSDPDVLTTINVDTTFGVLKGIRLK